MVSDALEKLDAETVPLKQLFESIQNIFDKERADGKLKIANLEKDLDLLTEVSESRKRKVDELGEENGRLLEKVQRLTQDSEGRSAAFRKLEIDHHALFREVNRLSENASLQDIEIVGLKADLKSARNENRERKESLAEISQELQDQKTKYRSLQNSLQASELCRKPKTTCNTVFNSRQNLMTEKVKLQLEIKQAQDERDRHWQKADSLAKRLEEIRSDYEGHIDSLNEKIDNSLADYRRKPRAPPKKKS